MSSELESRLAFFYFRTGDSVQGCKCLVTALAGESDADARALEVGRSIANLVPNLAIYQSLTRQLDSRRVGETAASSQLSQVRRGLSSYLERYLGMSNMGAAYPYTLPERIRFDVSDTLMTKTTTDREQPSITATLVPQIRERLSVETGIPIPDITVGTFRYAGLWFAVYLNGTPVVSENIPAVAGEYDPAVIAVNRLEAVLREHLAEIVTLSDTSALVQSWASDGALTEKASRLFDSPDARIRLHKFVRTMLRDRVPLVRADRILEGIEAVGLSDDPANAVRECRKRMKDALPGNAVGVVHFGLPEALEDDMTLWLSCHEGRQYLAASPDKVQAWLQQLRDLVQSATSDQVCLVVSEPELRVPLQILAAFERFNMLVMSAEEVLEPPARTHL
jgi:flagellar biosynthesis component FlhA